NEDRVGEIDGSRLIDIRSLHALRGAAGGELIEEERDRVADVEPGVAVDIPAKKTDGTCSLAMVLEDPELRVKPTDRRDVEVAILIEIHGDAAVVVID